jgi:catechol-2,3-dioxygenase
VVWANSPVSARFHFEPQDSIMNTVLASSDDILEHTRLLRHAPQSTARLFHTTLLLDDQSDLALPVLPVASTFPQSFTGSSARLVSKAVFASASGRHHLLPLVWDVGSPVAAR